MELKEDKNSEILAAYVSKIKVVVLVSGLDPFTNGVIYNQRY